MQTINLPLVTYDTLRDAISRAAAGPTEIVIPPGVHTVDPGMASSFCIDVSRTKELTICGAEYSNPPTIITPLLPIGLFAVGAKDLTISDIHFTRSHQMTTQGNVVAVGPGYIDIQIQLGFPSIADVFDGEVKDRSVRVYSRSKTNPRVLLRLPKISWKSYSYLGNDVWRLIRYAKRQTAPFKRGQLLGVRSKWGGQPYYITHSDNVRFIRLLWTRRTRGVFINTNNVHILHCRIERPSAIAGQAPIMAGNGGGPQIHGRNGQTLRGIVVAHNYFHATGDDSIALFNVDEGLVASNRIIDSYARGILLNNSESVILRNNRLTRAPLEYVDTSFDMDADPDGP